MTDDELWTVTPIPRADVEAIYGTHVPEGGQWSDKPYPGAGVFVFDGPVEPWRLAALVPDPLRRRTLLDRLCWWRR